MRERHALLRQIPSSNVRFEQNKCLVNLDKMSFTDADLVLLSPHLAVHLSSKISGQLSKLSATSKEGHARVLIDLSAEENFISDLGITALCCALEQLVREFNGRCFVRSLNVAFNNVSDDSCYVIARPVCVCACACLCMCLFLFLSLAHSLSTSMCVCVCVCVCVCMCLCVRERESVCMYMYMYMYVYVCVCVCACVYI
jgi:hypothetical protein